MRHGNANLLQVAPVTCAILAANGILFMLEIQHAGGMQGFSRDVLKGLGASQRELLWEGDWLRLIAPIFLHGGLMHLGCNCYTLYNFGPQMETHFGSSNYGTLYLLSGVVGVCFSQMFGGNLSVGASGAVFGLLGAEFIIEVMRSPVISRAWRRREVRVAFAWLVIYLMLGISGMMGGRIDNWNHFGGMLCGGLLACMFEMWRTHRRMGLPLLGVFLALIAAMIVLARWSVYSPAYHIHMALLAHADGQTNERDREYQEAGRWAKFWHKSDVDVPLIQFAQVAPETVLSAARKKGYAMLEEMFAMRSQMSSQRIAAPRPPPSMSPDDEKLEPIGEPGDTTQPPPAELHEP